MKRRGGLIPKLSMSRKNAVVGTLFVSLFIIGFLTVYLPAIITSIKYSFSETDKDFNTVFVGWSNYYHIFRVDPNYVRNLIGTLGSLVLDCAIIILYSLMICTLLNMNIKGRGVFRALLFLPVVISMGCIDKYMNYTVRSQDIISSVSEASGDASGDNVILSYIMSLSINEQMASILTDAVQNIYGIISKSGVQVVVFLTGLQSISPQIYEAAKVEGCTAWETYWKITFPLLTPLMTVNIVYTVIDSFTRSDNAVMNKILNYIMNEFNYGISSAMAWVYFIVLSMILTIIIFVLSKVTYYEN